jgi:glycosyltransferase involved in cell wall biosynthesis
VNQAELPQYYALADVFVLPSENEPWGLVINEVMASGVPVVASGSIGACADLVVEGITGFTYPHGDVAKLAAALAPLLKDGALRTRMGAAARERMRDWSYETCATGILEALRNTARAHR